VCMLCGVCGGRGGVGVVGVWGHSLRSTFHRLHLLRLWTPTIFYLNVQVTGTVNFDGMTGRALAVILKSNF
jgi:hypothetical protein